jgi:hypothetical protein
MILLGRAQRQRRRNFDGDCAPMDMMATGG